MELAYRSFEERDLPGVLRLWGEAGWGTLTEDLWREWFVDTPEGPCLVMIAEDDRGEVAGQMIFVPAKAVANGRETRSLRITAPVLRPDVRNVRIRSARHPAVVLQETGVDMARARGFGLMYAFPEHSWLPVFRWYGHYTSVSFETVALPFAARLPASSLTATRIGDFGPEYETLWSSAMASFSIRTAIVRSRGWLRFRNGGRVALEVRDSRDGTLVGYTSIKRATGLLMDAVARLPEDLGPVIAATLDWLSESDALAHGVDRLTAMETPALAPALRDLAFTRTGFRFLFTCRALDSEVEPLSVLPRNWYCMPGD